jgi:hypothetical protein
MLAICARFYFGKIFRELTKVIYKPTRDLIACRHTSDAEKTRRVLLAFESKKLLNYSRITLGGARGKVNE